MILQNYLLIRCDRLKDLEHYHLELRVCVFCGVLADIEKSENCVEKRLGDYPLPKQG